MEAKIAVSISDAARLVGVSRPTLYKWMALDGFPVVRIGSTVRIPLDAFKLWLEKEASQ